MASIQKSVSIDTKQELEIERYMKIQGIKYFSGAVYNLIHRGLGCRCSRRSKGGGVKKRQEASCPKKEMPVCLGEPGKGACETCNYTNSCANKFLKQVLSDAQNNI